MKKHLKTTLLFAVCIAFTIMAKAQKVIKEGVVTYTVEYDLPPNQQSMAAMLPKEFKVNFKGNYSQFKMDMGMFSTLIILDNNTNETLTLTDVPMQNKKIAVKMNQSEAEQMREMQSGEQDYDVTETTETKKIAGYNCKKYILKDKAEGSETELWATTEIQIPASALTSSIKKINGVPVAFSNKANGMHTKLTLKSISEESVPDINLTIPAGYETMDFKDLMSKMGG
ncbi:MAG TPA: DUF4412 domain-containing protein [Pelobium sp.]